MLRASIVLQRVWNPIKRCGIHRSVQRNYNTTREESKHVNHTPNMQQPQQQPQQEQQQKEPQNKIIGKFKELLKKYGYIGVGVYLGIYVLTLFGIFLLLEEDILSVNTVLQKLKEYGWDNLINTEDMKTRRKTNFAVAWVLTKFTEPVRFAVTLAVLPLVAKILKRR